MPQSRYSFYSLFDYDAANGILVPKVNLVINNTLLPEGVAINHSTNIGGLNLFNYIGNAVAGTWDEESQKLEIAGFY